MTNENDDDVFVPGWDRRLLHFISWPEALEDIGFQFAGASLFVFAAAAIPAEVHSSTSWQVK